MLKPNTRFLRHIIKDTDNHNKALLAKEAAESRARLKDLEHAEELKRVKTNPNARDIRKRQMGDIHAILGGKRRKREDEAEAGGSSNRESKDRATRSRDFKIRGHAEKKERDSDLFRDRHDDKRSHGRLDREERRSERKDSSRRGHRRSRSRSRSRSRDGSEDGDGRRHGRSRRDRSRSPRSRRRSQSPKERRHGHRRRSPLQESKSSPKRRKEKESDYDSEDDLMGPAPPPKYRGRGTFGGSSGIDRRFSESYDPKTDVQMDDNEGDGKNWDDAVEAFRDRQKLRQNKEERMRSAGFTDDIIQRVQSTKEQAEEDVKWSKAGEKREWDKGKVVGLDGGVVSGDEEL